MVQKSAPNKKPASRSTAASRKPPTSSSSSSKQPTATTSHDSSSLTIAEQQRLLSHFSVAFDAVLSAPAFPQLLQEIKQALFQRDFATAFGRADYLDAYAARWSPTRALCYAGLFRDFVAPYVPAAAAADGTTNMVCIGGCPAEHVAFASHIQQQRGHLTLLDSAPWGTVAEKMQKTLTSPLPLSKYASAATKAANMPFLASPEQLQLKFVQQDALEMTDTQWSEILKAGDDVGSNSNSSSSSSAVVVTLMFTLNELYTHSGIAKTTTFLKTLAASLPDQALLLVVDSPGSYSEATLGKDKKKYPMQWLLHHTLTGPASTALHWTRLESHDSTWFRLSDELDYPIQLENMRYQLHLYRKDNTRQSAS